MKMRTLGRTGVKVSPLCLGAMMFGQWGNPDHDESVRIIHRALDAGINFLDTADVYSAGESEEIVGKALPGPARPRRARDQGLRADGRRSELHGQLAALDHHGGREQPAASRYGLDRPLPDPPAGPDGRHRRDLGRADRSCPRGQDPLLRPAPRTRRRRSSRRSGSRRSAGASASSASSRRTRSWCEVWRRRCCRPARSTAWG